MLFEKAQLDSFLINDHLTVMVYHNIIQFCLLHKLQSSNYYSHLET